MLSLITPTGDRPQAFALCEKYVQRQTYKEPFEWIVIDDGEYPTECSMGQVVIRPDTNWHQHCDRSTQHRNLLLGLAAATGDIVVMIEDDDWYGSQYLEQVVNQFKPGIEIIGEMPARYYNVRFQQYQEFGRDLRHASLCQTAFLRSLIPMVEQICKDRQWIDVALWNSVQPRTGLIDSTSKSRNKRYPGNQVVGIKGMPGRAGVSRAHTDSSQRRWIEDSNNRKLIEWIGDDASLYQSYLQQNEMIVKRRGEITVARTSLETFVDGDSGQVRYKCPEHCGFDSYDQRQVLKHWRSVHASDTTSAPIGPTLFDSDDKPIRRDIKVRVPDALKHLTPVSDE